MGSEMCIRDSNAINNYSLEATGKSAKGPLGKALGAFRKEGPRHGGLVDRHGNPS